MKKDEDKIFDVAIIGGGVAGLAFALFAPRHWRVALFVKRPLGVAASAWAQGGMAAAVAADDSPANHIKDTLAAGDGLCDSAVVETVAQEAAAAARWLAAQGVRWSAAPGGAPALAQEGGHGRRRVLHVKDRSGAAIMDALVARVAARRNVVVFERHIAVDLFVRDGVCKGFYALNLRDNKVCAITAGAVALATGGGGRVYLYSSTPQDATGDGVGMAFRAGCAVRNMEFVQFHPTCLYHPQAPTLLVSEAARGEGARLLNAAGAPFTQAAGGDMAARDAVARAIDGEMKKTGADCVYLDFSARPQSFWRRRFPNLMRSCRLAGLRAPQEPAPVVPAAHYTCGGVATNINGQTEIKNLFALGETADTGLHGANRLASNSLLECVVVARRCAAACKPARPRRPIAAWDERRISPPAEAVMVAHNWEELRRVMWNYVGIARSDERLQRARRRVECIGEEVADFYARHSVSRDFLELRNLAQCAEVIIEGALARRESRGLHYNADCPNKNKTARPTVLRKADFARRARAVNARCPFSGRLVVAGGMLRWRGRDVGFCNPGCRDAFARAAAAGFAGASRAVLRARARLDSALEGALS